MAFERHSLYGFEVGTNKIGGAHDTPIQTGTETLADIGDGSIFPSALSIVAQRPTASLSSWDIAKVLDAIPLLGVNLATSALNMYGYLHALAGGRSAGSTHVKYVASNGILTLGQITASHQQNAVITANALLTSDPTGANDPIVKTESESVPTGFDDTVRFALGPITIESIAIGSFTSLTIGFGIQAEAEGAESNIWPTHSSIVRVVPVITIRGKNIKWLGAGAVPLGGLAATHLNTSFYLRKRKLHGDWTPDATAEHIKFTAAGMAYINDAFSGGQGAGAESEIVMPLTYDGTNNPIVIDTTSALP